MNYDLDDILRHNHELNTPSFINRWKQFGEKEKESVFRFFCYYTAFNFLYKYGNSRYEHCPDNDFLQKAKYTRDQCQVCDTVYYIIGDERTFNPFISVLSRESELVTQPVDRREDLRVTYGDCSAENIQKLFLNIYRIRCNLYHGSKEMRAWRDKAIVKEAADVLKYFLEYVVKKFDLSEE